MIGEALEIKAELRTKNTVFCCSVCEDWKNLRKESPWVITKISQFMPVDPEGRPQWTPQLIAILICKKCFKDLDLQDADIAIVGSLPNINGPIKI